MYESYQYEELFSQRLYDLRKQMKVSAREMSLSLGQNESYINRIECKKAYPSIQGFFYICEYLKISPAEFLDFENSTPAQLHNLIEDLKELNSEQLSHIYGIVKDLKKISKIK